MTHSSIEGEKNMKPIQDSFCGWCGTPFAQTESYPRVCANIDCKKMTFCNQAPVGVVIVPVTQGRKIGALLVKRDGGLGNPGYGKWAFPGGFQNSGESSQACAVRELKEEVGIDIREEDLEIIHTSRYSNDTDVQITFWLANNFLPFEHVVQAFRPNDETRKIKFTDTPGTPIAFESHQQALRISIGIFVLNDKDIVKLYPL